MYFALHWPGLRTCSSLCLDCSSSHVNVYAPEFTLCVLPTKLWGPPPTTSPLCAGPGVKNIPVPGMNGCTANDSLRLMTHCRRPGGFVLRGQPDPRNDWAGAGGRGGVSQVHQAGPAFPLTCSKVSFQPHVQSQVNRCISFPGCMSRTGCRSPMCPIISPAQRSCKYGPGRIGGPRSGGGERVFKVTLEVLRS